MLIREQDDGSLLLGQAAPRAWLADGKRIDIERAPTYYGPLGLTIASASASGRISAEITMADRGRPRRTAAALAASRRQADTLGHRERK